MHTVGPLLKSSDRPISFNYSKWARMKWTFLIILLTVFVTFGMADDADKWIQDLNDPSPSVRESAASALEQLNDSRVVGPMIKALKDENNGVRASAAKALGQLNDGGAVSPLIESLKDEDPQVRTNAAFSLGKLDDRRAVGPLIKALKDDVWSIRADAAFSLGQLNDSRAVSPLIESLKDEDTQVRTNAAFSLGKLNDRRAVGPLIGSLKDEDSMVRADAAKALGQLNDRRAIDPLTEVLKDDVWDVRTNAAWALDQLRFNIASIPQSWNLQSACPGTSARTNFSVKNVGETLQNLIYTGVIENITLREYEDHVGYKETWNKTVNVTESTKKISAELSSVVNDSNESEVALVFENPRGTANEENAALGTDDLGPLEISNPELGNWTLKVYGYNVPMEGKSFRVRIKEYAEENWSWITTKGPERLESDSNGTVEANLTIPKGTSLSRLDGYIKISSDSHTFEIPVTWISTSDDVGEYQIESQVRDGKHADPERYDDRKANNFIITESKPISRLRPNQTLISGSTDDPHEAETWKNKGNVLSRQGNLDEAIKAYDKALELDPEYASAWDAKGVSLAQQGKYDEAIQVFDKAIEMKPEYGDAWNNKGCALIMLRKYEEAIKALDKAIKLNPNDADPLSTKGDALAHQGKYDEAIQVLDKAIELKPEYCDAWNNKGYALAHQGKYDEAIQILDKAIELDQTNAVPFENKGFALSKLGRTEEANAAYAKAKELGYNSGLGYGSVLGT